MTAWYSTIELQSQVVVAGVAVYGLVYAVRQYNLARTQHNEDSRPYVQVELEPTVSGFFDLVIRNAGKSAAKNINIQFRPNVQLHEYSKKKINSYRFLKNMKFLAADKSFKFYFGSVMGWQTPISREFKVTLKYEDVGGKEYTSDQIIDARDYKDVTQLSRKGMHEIAKTLEDIKKLVDKTSKNGERFLSAFDKGMIERDSSYATLPLKENAHLLLNMLTVGIAGEYNPYPFVSDALIAAKKLREKLLVKPVMDEDDKELVGVLNKLQHGEFQFKQDEIIDEVIKALEKYLSRS